MQQLHCICQTFTTISLLRHKQSICQNTSQKSMMDSKFMPYGNNPLQLFTIPSKLAE